jgi:hypothetical protein
VRGDEISEWMVGEEELGWSERRTRALFKHIFRIVWPGRCPFQVVVDHQRTGGGSTSRPRKMEREMEGETASNDEV